MGKGKRDWWGYVKSMVARYPNRVNEDEKRAVERALEDTKKLSNGESVLKMIDLVYFKKSHTLKGAALAINYSYESARKFHSSFMWKVGENFSCKKLF